MRAKYRLTNLVIHDQLSQNRDAKKLFIKKEVYSPPEFLLTGHLFFQIGLYLLDQHRNKLPAVVNDTVVDLLKYR